MTNQLILENILKMQDGGPSILGPLDLHLPKGSKLSILGPSGSGKTTLLRIIAGLTPPDRGVIRFNTIPITHLPPHKRNFGLMFQEYALFPHLNVFQNIAFGLKMKKISKSHQEKRVAEMLELTHLSGFETRSVDELSGGERQRVALARTLAPGPELLMLDEPLSALDRVLRKRLLHELTKIISTLNITTIFVTHDHKEAFAAGSQIVLLNKGKIQQQGTAEDLCQNPASPWVQQFMA